MNRLKVGWRAWKRPELDKESKRIVSKELKYGLIENESQARSC